MHAHIQKTNTLQGDITLPGAKSEVVRALFFALLGSGVSTIRGVSDSQDLQNALSVCRALGADITHEGSTLRVSSQGAPLTANPTLIQTGDSGITTRFVLPILGLRAHAAQPLILEASLQMQARPMASLIEALGELGLNIKCLKQPGSLPLEITGELKGGHATLSGLTSQYISALLIALPLAPISSEITVTDLNERPYVDMTLSWLNRLGIKYSHQKQANKDIYIIPGQQSYSAFDYTVPGDFSGAACFIAAGLLFNGEITLKNVDVNDKQGDKRLITLAQAMGGHITCHENTVIIQGGADLHGIDIDANDVPDLLPVLAVLGTCAQGKMRIENVPQARLKETDRIHSMTQGLRAMGANLEESPDGMVIERSALRGATLNGYGDHRTVMALTLAGLCAEGTTQVSDALAVNKTYPQFFKEMKKLGANVEVQQE